MPSNPLSFKGVYKLRCPYCLKTSFPKTFWSRWPERCNHCNYAIEREAGYFSAVPWVFTYTPAAFLAIGLWLLIKDLGLASGVQLSIVLTVAVLFSLFSLPYAKAFWLYIEHYLHPLEKH